jgi:hypothetical protein
VVEIKLDLMIDLEGLGTGPETTILTIAAQEFNPLVRDSLGRSYYVRVDLESQADRTIEQGTIDWWATQPPVVREQPSQQKTQGNHKDARMPFRNADQALRACPRDCSATNPRQRCKLLQQLRSK